MPNKKHIGFRPTWAEIDLDNLEHNYQQLRRHLSPKTKMMVTVKADAYGHGLIPVSKKLISCGVDFLGVASIDEGIKLRESGITAPILVLGMVLKEDIEPLFEFDLATAVCEMQLAKALNAKARSLKKKINIHVKVDTGMGRIGVKHEDALSLVKEIAELSHLFIEGIFTHFAFADMNKKFTLYQLRLFERLVRELDNRGVRIPFVHAANSMGVLDYKHSHFNMVRPGLVIYGIYPKENVRINLKPVLSLKTKVVFVKKVSAGVGISYGHEYTTRKSTKIATLPIGYGDGYPRNLSNRAPVLIKGKRFKICGRICMDQIMVDTGNSSVKAGDEVVLIGAQKKARIAAEELAQLSATIPYEIVCGLGSRIPRVYLRTNS